MTMRIRLARFLLHLGEFIQSLPVMVMKPHDLVEFNKSHYKKPQTVQSWSNESFLETSLWDNELDMLDDVPDKTGDLLLLGIGGGREAIALSKMGFRITGIDFVYEMVESAKKNALRHNIVINGMVQDISNLDVPAQLYDIVWLSSAAYSSVPSLKRRVKMVQGIANTLKPGGFFLFQFHRDPRMLVSSKGYKLRRLMARCLFGNREYENGDVLWGNVEFLHAFASEQEVRAEIEQGGLSLIRFQTEMNPVRCGAICQKSQ